MSMTTQDALEQSMDLIEEFSVRFGELLDDVHPDLPPDVARKLIRATNAVTDAREKIEEYLD